MGHQGGHGSEEPGASLPKSSSAVGSFGCGDFRDSCFQELKACVNLTGVMTRVHDMVPSHEST